jgi:hypothetical protein
VQCHAPDCGDVGDAGGDARGKGMEQILDRRRTVVIAAEHLGMVGVGDEIDRAALFAPGAIVLIHDAAAVIATDPAVAGAELELGKLRLLPDCSEGGDQPRCVDAVAR